MASKRWYVPHLLGWYNIIRITYQDVIVQDGDKKVQENVTMIGKMSKTEAENVQERAKMSKTEAENVQELTEEELALPLEPIEPKSAKEKSQRRRQAIVGLISDNPSVSLEEMSEKLDVNIKTIWRDITTLKLYGVIERIGGDFGGEWKILNKKK